MMTSITGVYRHGQIILTEQPNDLPDDTQVIVTFLTNDTSLAAHGLDAHQAADLRARLDSFAAEWDRPEMDVYNDYDTAKAAL